MNLSEKCRPRPLMENTLNFLAVKLNLNAQETQDLQELLLDVVKYEQEASRRWFVMQLKGKSKKEITELVADLS
jgi:hypothetical protein